MINNQFKENCASKSISLGGTVSLSEEMKNFPKKALSNLGSEACFLSQQNEGEQAWRFAVYFQDFYRPTLNEIQVQLRTHGQQLLTYLDKRG